MAVFWDVCRLVAKMLFLRPNPFFGDNPVLVRNSSLSVPKVHFSGFGPPKHLPNAYVYKGFCAGGPKVAFGANGQKNDKNAILEHAFKAKKVTLLVVSAFSPK